MPELSRFFGIIIRMYMEAVYNIANRTFMLISATGSSIWRQPCNILAGNLPLRQQRLVEAWAELHQEELEKDWDLLQSGKLPKPIEPLR